MIRSPIRMPCFYVMNHQIGLKSREGTVVMFPNYLKEVSMTIYHMLGDFPDNTDVGNEDNPIPIPYPFTTLDILASLVRILPSAARNTSAQPAPMEHVYQVIDEDQINPQTITILVNSLVWNRAFPILNRLSPQEVYNLYRAINHLNIPSLIHAIARFIGFKLFNQVITEKTRIKSVQTRSSHVNVFLAAVRKVTLNTFPDELVTRIAKYVYLHSLGVEEKTIADYIGINGFPVVNSDLDLSNKSLTSLSGLEFISNDAVIAVDLYRNYILGSDLDLNFPSDPFRGVENLQGLYLFSNHISKLPNKVFHNLSNLQELYLYNNYLSLTKEAFIRNYAIPESAWLLFNPQFP